EDGHFSTGHLAINGDSFKETKQGIDGLLEAALTGEVEVRRKVGMHASASASASNWRRRANVEEAKGIGNHWLPSLLDAYQAAPTSGIVLFAYIAKAGDTRSHVRTGCDKMKLVGNVPCAVQASNGSHITR